MNQFKIQHSWDGAIVLDNLQVWYRRKDQYNHLPFFVMCEVWKARNASIFSNFLQKLEVIYLKILSSFFEWSKETLISRRRCYSFPSLLQEYLVGFFDGVTMNGACGVGLVIKIDKDRIIKGWLKAGMGTNTRV